MITLRPVQPEDADILFPLIYKTAVTDTLLWDGPSSLDEYRQGLAERAERSARGEIHLFTIIESASGQPVGMTDIRPMEDFRADVGIWIGQPYHGRGYGTQAVRLLVEYGFGQLKMAKIEAYIFCGNWSSRRIFEKNGFILEGTIRQSVRKRGQLLDEWLMGITHADFASSSYIVHLCQRTAWQEAQAQGEYRGEGSLEMEGFIHCSRPDQILRVANSFFQGKPDLELLWIDPTRLRAEIRWETADGDRFPHIYGPLNLDALLAVRDFAPDADGVFRNIPGI
jgi:uncharacterized protein (DUF952 family)/RimJ/RimL family protein N-acetyltransferase